MLTAVLVIAGAFAAWLLIDRFMLRRDERLHRGHAGWSAADPNRTFHSTGWEETVPPLEVHELRASPRHERASDRAAA
jgi:hypothetical protein